MAEDQEKVEFIRLGDRLIRRQSLEIQTQYLSRYVTGKHGSPNLGEGLQFRNLDTGSYHTFEIRK
jgi:hypothetical protein